MERATAGLSFSFFICRDFLLVTLQTINREENGEIGQSLCMFRESENQTVQIFNTGNLLRKREIIDNIPQWLNRLGHRFEFGYKFSFYLFNRSDQAKQEMESHFLGNKYFYPIYINAVRRILEEIKSNTVFPSFTIRLLIQRLDNLLGNTHPNALYDP